MKIPFDRPFTRRWLARVVSALPALLVAVLVLGFVALLFGSILRQQWDRQFELTEAWYQEHVGSLEPEAYLRPKIPDEINLAVAVQAIATDPFLKSEDYQRAIDVGQRLFGENLNGANEEPLTTDDLEALRQIVEQQARLSRSMDALEEFTETRLEHEPELGDSVLMAMSAARFRSAQVAWLAQQGECQRAGAKAVSLERMALVFSSEAHRLYWLVGTALEKQFYQAIQQLAEAELFGRCGTQVQWVALDAAVLRLAEAKASFAEAIAAEGSLVTSWRDLYPYQPTLVERVLGDNAGGMMADALAVFGGAALEASGRSGSVPAAPVTPLPARWLEHDIMEQILAIDPQGEALYGAEHVAAWELTRYAIRQARCARAAECIATTIDVPSAELTWAAPVISVEGDVATLTFLPADPEHWRVRRARGALTLRLPAGLLPPQLARNAID